MEIVNKEIDSKMHELYSDVWGEFDRNSKLHAVANVHNKKATFLRKWLQKK
jgi:hypothetical protein